MAKKTTKKTNKIEDMTQQERLVCVSDSFNKTLENYGFSIDIVIRFREKRGVPMLGRFASWLLEKSGGSLDIQFIDKLNKK